MTMMAFSPFAVFRALIFALPVTLAACQDAWLKGAEIAALLPGRLVIYGGPDATIDTAQWQSWQPDGTTRSFHSGLWASAGKWRVSGDFYCEMIGQADAWTCFVVYLEDDGKRLRFDGDWAVSGKLQPKGTPLP